MAALVTPSNNEETDKTHLLVSPESGVSRIAVSRILDELFENNRPKHRLKSTRDSWVQTDKDGCSGVVAQDQLLAPLASEEEFCSDTEQKNNSRVDSPCQTQQEIRQLNAIADLSQDALEAQISILPGCRDKYDRSIVYISLKKMQLHNINATHLAETLLYFQSIPKRETMCLGFLVLVDGRDVPWDELYKTFALVEESLPGTISLVLGLPTSNPCQSSLSSIFHLKFESISNENQLLTYISRDQLLVEYGGLYQYDHEEWIQFHKFLDPFIVSCHQMGCRLVELIQDLREGCLPSVLTKTLIEQQRKQIMDVLGDKQLKFLESEGLDFLKQLEKWQEKFQNNPDYESARQTYGDNAIGYVQVKRESDICIVKGKMTPEHKIKTKAYAITLTCDESSGVINSLVCDNCAASAGGCKHMIAFLFWVHRKCSLPSPTEIECYWKKSKLSSVGSSQKFIHASSLGKKDIKDLPPKCPSILEDCMKIANARNSKNLQLCNYFSEPSNLEKISLHYLIVQFTALKVGTTVDEFLQYLKDMVPVQLCSEVAQASLGQNQNPIWHELRYGRITASKLYEASQCANLNGSLVETILGAKFNPTKAIKRGSHLEKEVVQKVQQKHNIKIKSSGILLKDEFPIFGASPDGIATDFIVEVKCPTSEKTMEKYFDDNKPAAKHYAQMQLQMLFADKQKGLFCVAHPDFEKGGNVTEIWINRDDDYCENIMHKALDFWKKAIFPQLYKISLS